MPRIQIAETCNPDNEAQIITSALPETAVESDTAALPKVLDDLEKKDVLPEEMVADTPYCSDENVQEAQRRGVELIGPTKEGAESVGSSDESKIEEAQASAYGLNVDDFQEHVPLAQRDAKRRPEIGVQETGPKQIPLAGEAV